MELCFNNTSNNGVITVTELHMNTHTAWMNREKLYVLPQGLWSCPSHVPSQLTFMTTCGKAEARMGAWPL